MFMLDAPFEITHKCCKVMKKDPAENYEDNTRRKPIIGNLATESYLRAQKWVEQGCNAFKNSRPVSNPMSFWLENDVLLYIAVNDLKIASVYGEIVRDYEVEGQVDGQMSLGDLPTEFGIFDKETPLLKTTGCNRTGCMFCMFGCTTDNWDNFERISVTHPKIYDYMMKPESEGGLGYKEKIDWINEHGNMNIKY